MPNLKISGIRYYANVLKEDKKKHKYCQLTKLSIKMHIVEQTKHQLQHNIKKHNVL